MPFTVKIYFSFTNNRTRGTNPSKLNSIPKEGSISTKTESITFKIDRDKINLGFKRELTQKILNSKIRRNSRFKSCSIENNKFFKEPLFLDSNQSYKLDDNGIWNIVSDITYTVLGKLRELKNKR